MSDRCTSRRQQRRNVKRKVDEDIEDILFEMDEQHDAAMEAAESTVAPTPSTSADTDRPETCSKLTPPTLEELATPPSPVASSADQSDDSAECSFSDHEAAESSDE